MIASPKRVKPSLTKQYHVAVDRHSGYATYEAVEKAAQAIKKQYPILQVSVYDTKEQQYAVLEKPRAAADPQKKSPHRTTNVTSQTPTSA